MNKIGIKCDLCGTDTGYFKYFCLKCWVEQVEQKIMQLEAENRRLRAVVEAARKVTGNVIRCVVAMDDEPGLKERWRCVKEDDLRQLREALAALEEVQNHEMENREQP